MERMLLRFIHLSTVFLLLMFLGGCIDRGGKICEGNADHMAFERLVDEFTYPNITRAYCYRLQQEGRALISKTKTCSDAFEIELSVRPFLSLDCSYFD